MGPRTARRSRLSRRLEDYEGHEPSLSKRVFVLFVILRLFVKSRTPSLEPESRQYLNAPHRPYRRHAAERWRTNVGVNRRELHIVEQIAGQHLDRQPPRLTPQ